MASEILYFDPLRGVRDARRVGGPTRMSGLVARDGSAAVIDFDRGGRRMTLSGLGCIPDDISVAFSIYPAGLEGRRTLHIARPSTSFLKLNRTQRERVIPFLGEWPFRSHTVGHDFDILPEALEAWRDFCDRRREEQAAFLAQIASGILRPQFLKAA